MKRIAFAGNIITEYGLLIGLVGFVSVAALQLLGGSTSNLLSGVSNRPAAMKMMSLDFSGDDGADAKPVSLTGAGYLKQVRNRRTGKMEFKLTTDSNSGATNVTSLDGSQWNTLGQFQIADTLWHLAEKQTNPESREYIMNLAKASYYMGAAEGEIDAVKQLQFHDPGGEDFQYGKINGYVDIQRLQQDIMTTLNNAPAGLDKQTLQQVNALAADVYNIGQSYVNTLSSVDPNAQYSFYLPTDLNQGGGKGIPGQTLTVESDQISYCDEDACGKPQSKGGPSVEQVFTIDELRVISKDVLATFGVTPEPVVATFTDATQLDKKAAYR